MHFPQLFLCKLAQSGLVQWFLRNCNFWDTWRITYKKELFLIPSDEQAYGPLTPSPDSPWGPLSESTVAARDAAEPSSKGVFPVLYERVPAKYPLCMSFSFLSTSHFLCFLPLSLSGLHVFAFTWWLWSVVFLLGFAYCTDEPVEMNFQWLSSGINKPTAGIPTFRDLRELVLGELCSGASGFQPGRPVRRHPGCCLLIHRLVERECV